MGLLSQPDVDVAGRRAVLRHHRPRGGRLVRGAGGRAAVRVRLWPPRQRRIGRADHRCRAAALLRPDRAGAARRGHELPLPAGVEICGGRSGAARARRRRAGAGRSPDLSRRHLDDRCAVSRDRGVHCVPPARRYSGGRDGGRFALRVRCRPCASGDLPRPRVQPARMRRWRLRERRRQRRRRIARPGHGAGGRVAVQDADRGYRNGLRRAGWLGTRRRADVVHPMVSTLNVAVGALSALLLWTCLGAAITRRLAPGPLMLPMALVVGWAVHSVLALPLFRLIGLSTASVLAVAVVTLAFAMVSARGGVPSGAKDMADDLADDVAVRVPRWAFALAALLALAPALAVMPKAADGGAILAGPVFDHAKVAMIDEMARLGLPPGNPFFGDASDDARLVYYYLWHFGAAELVRGAGITGWEADIALTWFTAFASLAVMMGLAVRFSGRRAAAWWVAPLALAGSLRPVLSFIWGAENVRAVLMPGTGFAGWLFQSAWVPQHLMSATCIVAAVMLMTRLAEPGWLRVGVVGLMVAA